MTKTLGALLMVATLSSVAFGQHSDIEFGYDDFNNPQEIEIEQDNVTTENLQFFESEFEQAFPGDPFATDEPGFATGEPGEELRFNPGDNIFARILDASDPTLSSFGAGFVNYYNPNSATPNILEAVGEITVFDDTDSTDDLVLDGGSFSGSISQFLGTGDDSNLDLGGIHDHLTFELTGDAVGAYGVLLQVEADFAGTSDDIDLVSDPFWIIVNRGLSEDEFEGLGDFQGGGALAAFGVAAVPEPSSVLVLSGAVGAMLVRRRRRA